VNLSGTPVDFVENFYDDNGNPMQVTFKSFPQEVVTTSSSLKGHLNGNQSFNFALFNVTANTQQGWAALDYDSTAGRLGGYEAFRYFMGIYINEGLAPLSDYTDTTFMMPFDNIQGFVTGLALCNPVLNVPNHVTVKAYDTTGNLLGVDVVTVPPGGHLSYVVSDRMPGLANQTGMLFAKSDSTRLAAVGIRMNVPGGYTFTSIPIMNYIPGL